MSMETEKMHICFRFAHSQFAPQNRHRPPRAVGVK